MSKRRAIKRLTSSLSGTKKAQVATKKQFKNILWQSSRGDLGRRNVAIVWMLFGSGLRINEVAHLTIGDLIRPSGELKTTFSIKAKYTKTDASRAAFILSEPHIRALERWIAQMIEEKICLTGEPECRGLNKDWPMFRVTKKGKTWRQMGFNDKKYFDSEGNERTTKVCRTLQNRFSELLKDAGLFSGSTHSGRRTLATWLERQGTDEEIIQKILGHNSVEMTLEYIDPDYKRMRGIMDTLYAGTEEI